jgi:chemotaxis protein MotA
MDIATIIGLIGGMSCIIFVMVDGGDWKVFLHIQSIIIVYGGMFFATMIHFSLPQFLKMSLFIKKTLLYKLPSEKMLIQKLVTYSAINRRDGALALERQIPDAGDGFLVKGLQMVIDGQSDEAIEKQLTMEIDYLRERHADGKKMLDFMGSSAPAMGMVATLIGLVQMMGTMNDPSKIGAGMAVALIGTFHGALGANMFFLPLAGKLGVQSKRESLLREMIVEGLLGIVRGESPTGVREKMQAFVSDRSREDIKPTI